MGAPVTANETKPSEGSLDGIRVKTNRVDRNEAGQPASFQPAGPKKQTREKMSSGSVMVGIDIGHKSVNLAKVARSHNKWELLDYKSIPIPAGLGKNSSGFGDFLKSEVAPFCDHAGKTGIWAIISSAQAHVQLVRIPKVPEKHFEAAVQWSLKKEIAFDEKDYSFGYEIRGETVEGGNKKDEVICYFAPVEEIEESKYLFSKIGVRLSGLSIVPLAVQNIFMSNAATSREKQTACLFIGDNYSRIDLYAGGKLIMTRDIKTGINSMSEMLAEDYGSRAGNGAALSGEEALETIFAFAQGGSGPISLPGGLAVSRENVEDVIVPVMERLAGQVERTFKHFSQVQGYGKIEKIYISSLMPVCREMTGHFSEQLGVECVVFDPLKETLQTIPPAERLALVPAFGIALSDDARTPNFITSYKERKKSAYIARANRMILAALAVSLLACAAATGFEWQGAAREKAELAGLERQVKIQNSPPVSRREVLDMALAARQRTMEHAGLGRKYRGIALIGEISSLTPKSVSLRSFKADFPEQTRGRKPHPGGGRAGSDAVISGLVSGNEETLEATLAAYAMKLKSSPLISGVSVRADKAGHARRTAFLPFEIDLKLAGGSGQKAGGGK
ncbi:MAG: pilus assembly protein PilM [Nitrospiraceae bacterium]|nr:pilus assembly protein PilM [Nitrospiraceae bacterium]